MKSKFLTQPCGAVDSISPRTADLLLDLGEDATILRSAHGGRLANDVGYQSEPSFNRAFWSPACTVPHPGQARSR
jgi:hypothetical protein